MPTDEVDQDGHFFFNHPERGGLLRCLGARSHCYCCLDQIPPLRGGGDKNKNQSSIFENLIESNQ